MVALVTGASSGIGLELARIAAAHSHDLVLVARSESKLSELARELTAAHRIEVQVVVADLARPGVATDVAARVSATGIDVLVNNAGFGLYGHFLETSLETELQMIQLNIVSLTELT